jgi:transcriptional regulator with XRE-family HTH domain
VTDYPHARAGEWLRKARKRRQRFARQADFAAALGVQQQLISNYERGLSQVPEKYVEPIANLVGYHPTTVRRHLGLSAPRAKPLDIRSVTNKELLRELARRVNEGIM